jgi:hypothetical protein
VGSIKTVESLGAPFSHLVGELLVDVASYPAAYGVLSIAAFLPIIVYWLNMPSGFINENGENLSVNSSVYDANSSTDALSRNAGVDESGSGKLDNSRSGFL